MLKALFLGLSTNQRLRRFAESSQTGRKMSRRFVAGESVESLMEAAEAVNQLGIRVSVDYLGENVSSRENALASGERYHLLLDEIDRRKLDANVSLKLTQLGLDVDEQLTRDIAGELVSHAARIGNFIRIDMESSAYTQRTIELTRALHRGSGGAGHVGAVLQSYLRSSADDARLLVSEGIRVRLCKGAYREPPAIAYQAKSEVDANYVRLAKFLLKSGTFHGLATHDEAIINEIKSWAEAEGVAPSSFEFQMLYGIRRDLQRKLASKGWGMRVYIPFGAEWYPYFMRRLAERPANVWFLAKNVLRR